MTRDDIAAVGDVIARSGMRNQLRAARVFMGLAIEIEKADEAKRREIAAVLRDVASSIVATGGMSAEERSAEKKRMADFIQETLPLKGKGRSKGPMDENE